MSRDGLARLRLDDPPTVIGLGVIALGLILLPVDAGPVSTVVGGLGGLVLALLPGQALRLALLPPRARGSRPVGLVDRWSWTVALGLAVPVLGVFVLGLAPGGIRRAGWAVLLGAVVLVAGVVALIRHGRAEPAPRPRPRTTVGVLSTVATAVIAAVALWVGIGSAAAVVPTPFTQLSLVPRETAAAADPNARGPVLTVDSSEDRPHSYRLDLETAPGAVVQSWTFPLAPGERWQDDVTSPSATRAVLYRDTEPAPYRQVWLGP